MKPLITVIVAVLNGEATLQRCIDSVADQTYAHKELIIMDGCSVDGTVEILRANDNRITYWESKPDRGIYHAWNKALEHAQGEWICFLGADDYFWDEHVLENMAEHLVGAGDVRVVYGRVAMVTREGEGLLVKGQPWNEVANAFKHRMSIPHQGVMHHRSLFDSLGKFDESFVIAGDYELLLRELKTRQAMFCDLTVTAMSRGGLSGSLDNCVKVLKEFATARRKNGFGMPPIPWFWSYIKTSVIVLFLRIFGHGHTCVIVDLYRRATGRPYYWTR